MTDEQLPLTVINAKERHKKIREESDRIEKEKAEKEAAQQERDAERHKVAVAEAIQREDKFIDSVTILSGNETMEIIHARVRAIRDEKPANAEIIYPVLPLSARMQKQRDEEMAAGARKVAEAEALQVQQREARAKYELEEQMRNAGTPLVVPNPTQGQVFPTVKATLPGSK